MNGDVVEAISAGDVLIVTGSEDRQGLEKMKQIVQKLLPEAHTDSRRICSLIATETLLSSNLPDPRSVSPNGTQILQPRLRGTRYPETSSKQILNRNAVASYRA